MNTIVTYPADQPVEVFQAGQAVILQVDAFTMDNRLIPKNTPATIHNSELTYKIDRRTSGATGNPYPDQVEYHFSVSRTVDKEHLGVVAYDVINDVLLRPPKGDRVKEKLAPNKSYCFLKSAVEYRLRNNLLGTFDHKEYLPAGHEIKILGGPTSKAGDPPTGRDYHYAPLTRTKEVVAVRGKPLGHSAFRAA